jgi:hypothetical protein
MRSVIRRSGVSHHHPKEESAPPSLLTGLDSGFETKDVEGGSKLKPSVVRLSLTPSQCTPTTVKEVIEKFAAPFGAELNLLVEFDGPEKVSTKFTSAQAKGLVNLAGIKGLKCLELGNETSYGYQYGDGFSNESYKLRAKEYAQRVREAGEALAGTGLGVSCQADDGNSGSSVWVNEMYAQVPELHKYISAWTIHPYPSTTTNASAVRIERMYSQVGAHGGSGVSVDVTEWGVPTDNGNTLNDGTHLTYAEAATFATGSYNALKAAAGTKLRQFIIYQVRDQRPPGSGSEREWYFGALQRELGNKGEWTKFVEKVMGE